MLTIELTFKLCVCFSVIVGFTKHLVNWFYYRQDLPEGQLCRYFVYSRADFRPAGATRCTDQGEMWHSMPNFTLIGSGVGVSGPQN